MENNLDIFWNFEKLGRIENYSTDMWYMEGTWHSYKSTKSDWDLLLINAGASALPDFGGTLLTDTNQTQFGWTYSRMGYKSGPVSVSDFTNKSIGAFRVSPTVYTFSFISLSKKSFTRYLRFF